MKRSEPEEQFIKSPKVASAKRRALARTKKRWLDQNEEKRERLNARFTDKKRNEDSAQPRKGARPRGGFRGASGSLGLVAVVFCVRDTLGRGPQKAYCHFA